MQGSHNFDFNTFCPFAKLSAECMYILKNSLDFSTVCKKVVKAECKTEKHQKASLK